MTGRAAALAGGSSARPALTGARARFRTGAGMAAGAGLAAGAGSASTLERSAASDSKSEH